MGQQNLKTIGKIICRLKMAVIIALEDNISPEGLRNSG